MIFYIEPVANIASISINRQRFAFKSVQNDERNKLLGKLERAVIVGAVGGQNRQAIGVKVRPHQVVGGRLRRCIRAIGGVACRFRKRRFIPSQRSVYLVGGYM